jgi:hypothetical protein
MTNALRASNHDANMRNRRKTRLKLVPNQAFYQAEPQPDLVVSFCANAARLTTSHILQRMARSMRSGRTIFVADAHRDDGKRFVARADEKMTAFVELESQRVELQRPSLKQRRARPRPYRP